MIDYYLTKHHLYTYISKKNISLSALLVKLCLYSSEKPELSFLISLSIYNLYLSTIIYHLYHHLSSLSSISIMRHWVTFLPQFENIFDTCLFLSFPTDPTLAQASCFISHLNCFKGLLAGFPIRLSNITYVVYLHCINLSKTLFSWSDSSIKTCSLSLICAQSQLIIIIFFHLSVILLPR